MDFNNIYNMFKKFVKNHGDKWRYNQIEYEPEDINSEEQLYKCMNSLIKDYDRHSALLIVKDTIANQKIKSKNLKPDLHFKDKIGKMVFHPFIAKKENAEKEQNEIIKLIYDTIDKWTNLNMKKLILDLRHFTGGSYIPYVIGLQKIIGERTLYGIKEENSKITWINLIDGDIKSSNKLVNNNVNKQKLQIRILINENTKSAGEFLALMFKGQFNTKLIGTNTGGLLSFNKTIKMNNQIILLLTKGEIIDVNRNECSLIKPDVIKTDPLEYSKIN